MKYTIDRPFAEPDKAARRQLEHAHAFQPVQDGRIYIEKLNGPFLFGDKCRRNTGPALIWRSRDWLLLHDSGTFVKLTQSGRDLFA
jgi:hypothetical protein